MPVRYTLEQIQSFILYEDESILVFHKPSGLAVQTEDIMQQDLQSLLRRYLKTDFLGVVHRLDQPVEGIVIIAKNKKAASFLGNQTQDHAMDKQYLAVAIPQSPLPITGESIELVDYLKKRPKENFSEVVDPETPGAKKSNLTYEVLSHAHQEELDVELYLLKVMLGTGRHHQIRVQLSHTQMQNAVPFAGGDRCFQQGAALRFPAQVVKVEHLPAHPLGIKAKRQVAAGFIKIRTERIVRKVRPCPGCSREGFYHQVLRIVKVVNITIQVQGQAVTVTFHQLTQAGFVSFDKVLKQRFVADHAAPSLIMLFSV